MSSISGGSQNDGEFDSVISDTFIALRGKYILPQTSPPDNYFIRSDGTQQLVFSSAAEAELGNVNFGGVSVISGNMPSFSGTSGTEIQDSGIASANILTNPLGQNLDLDSNDIVNASGVSSQELNVLDGTLTKKWSVLNGTSDVLEVKNASNATMLDLTQAGGLSVNENLNCTRLYATSNSTDFLSEVGGRSDNRYSSLNDKRGPAYAGHKSRGSIQIPAAALNGDDCLVLRGLAHDGVDFAGIGGINITCDENITPTNRGSRIEIDTVNIGNTLPTTKLTISDDIKISTNIDASGHNISSNTIEASITVETPYTWYTRPTTAGAYGCQWNTTTPLSQDWFLGSENGTTNLVVKNTIGQKLIEFEQDQNVRIIKNLAVDDNVNVFGLINASTDIILDGGVGADNSVRFENDGEARWSFNHLGSINNSLNIKNTAGDKVIECLQDKSVNINGGISIGDLSTINYYKLPLDNTTAVQNSIMYYDTSSKEMKFKTKAYSETFFKGNAISTSQSPTNTYSIVAGIRNSGLNSLFSPSGGISSYTGFETRVFKASVNVSWQSGDILNDTYSLAIFKNGVLIPSSESRAALDNSLNWPRNCSCESLVSLSQNDFLDVRVKNLDATQSVLIIDFGFNIIEI